MQTYALESNDANEAALSGASLASWAMEPRAQLVQGRGIQRKRGCTESMRRCADRLRQARAAPRPGPHVGGIAGKAERHRFIQSSATDNRTVEVNGPLKRPFRAVRGFMRRANGPPTRLNTRYPRPLGWGVA
jgi:hypothetical protein